MESSERVSLHDRFLLLNQYRKELMGFAAIWIALLHSFAEGPLWGMSIPVVTRLTNRGNVGVEIFLLLSGVGLFFSMSKDDSVIPFYRKRIARVVVPWLIVSIPYWLIRGYVTDCMTVKWFMVNWTELSFLLDGTITVWYVVFIIVMYLLYPVVFRLQKKRSEAVLLLVGIVGVANMLLFLLGGEIYDKYEIALTRIPIFLVGSYLGESLYRKDSRSDRHKVYLVTAYALAAAAMFLLRTLIQQEHPSLAIMFYRYGGAGIAIILMLILCYIFDKMDLCRVRRVLTMFGNISLEFYLTNVFVRNLAFALELADYEKRIILRIIDAVIIFGLSVVLSWLFTKGMAAVQRTKHRTREEVA